MYINRKGVQFSTRDSWDSSSLSPIIVSWLKNFKDKYSKCPFAGVPSNIMIELFPNCEEYTEEHIEKGSESFMSEIDEIIWALESDDIPDDLVYNGEIDQIIAHKKRRDDALALFGNRYFNLWW